MLPNVEVEQEARDPEAGDVTRKNRSTKAEKRLEVSDEFSCQILTPGPIGDISYAVLATVWPRKSTDEWKQKPRIKTA